ncbi:hypothetical protein NL108_011930 [Boleophthalmus pectinirostris]|nr:hypothetical protein NL108_011930 [Boleophthalmus pectinirostris]
MYRKCKWTCYIDPDYPQLIHGSSAQSEKGLCPGDVEVLERWKDTVYQQSAVVFVPGDPGVPHPDRGGDGFVELHQHLGWQLGFHQLPQKIQNLLGPVEILCLSDCKTFYPNCPTVIQ